MDSKEIRVGNYVFDSANKILHIDWFENDKACMRMMVNDIQVHPLTDYIKYLRPIPLSDLWLLRFGFEKSIENDETLPCYKKGKYTVALCLKNKWQFWIRTVDIYNSPQYVHQLQNIMFDLTGEELKLKDEPK